MITYTVRIAERAVECIESYRRFIALDRLAPISAQRWVDKIFDEITGLATFPKRCPLAPENKKTAYEVRMRVVGKYLILFHVDDASQTVWYSASATAINDRDLVSFPSNRQHDFPLRVGG